MRKSDMNNTRLTKEMNKFLSQTGYQNGKIIIRLIYQREDYYSKMREKHMSIQKFKAKIDQIR